MPRLPRTAQPLQVDLGAPRSSPFLEILTQQGLRMLRQAHPLIHESGCWGVFLQTSVLPTAAAHVWQNAKVVETCTEAMYESCESLLFARSGRPSVSGVILARLHGQKALRLRAPGGYSQTDGSAAQH